MLRAYVLLGPAARAGTRTLARDSRVSIAFAVVDAARTATVTFIASHAFSATGLFPFDASKPMGSKYVRQSEEDVERDEESRKPHLPHTGSRVLTNPAFLRHLAGRLAPKEVAEADHRTPTPLLLHEVHERMFGPTDGGANDTEADVVDAELGEIDMLEPIAEILARLHAENERLDPSAPGEGEE